MSARKTRIALAATSQSLMEARQAVNHFAARVSDPDAKLLMSSLLGHHLTAISDLRVQLISSLPPQPLNPSATQPE